MLSMSNEAETRREPAIHPGDENPVAGAIAEGAVGDAPLGRGGLVPAGGARRRRSC
jgi:hypothetical protein